MKEEWKGGGNTWEAHWPTIALDGSADEGKLQFLLDMSYELTK